MTKMVALVMLTLTGAALGANKTVWDGVYTAGQADRGRIAYFEKCASCHGENMEGTQGSAVEVDGTPLIGPEFIEKWREDDLSPLFTYIQTGMPRETADSVTDAVKIDILAFILRSNDFPAGSSELTADLAANIMLVGKDGPKPLPNGTPVRAVGCLTQGTSNVWLLTKTSEPMRTRTPEETHPAELKAALEHPLGTLTFRLPSLDFAIPGVKPTNLKGHKVHIKGVLYRQPDNERITVTAIASLAATCSP